MFKLRLLGSVVVQSPAGPLTGRVTQRARLALLAMLAVARRGPVSRDRLLAYFWPESDTASARHLLADSVYLLRKTLGEHAIISVGDDLALDSNLVGSDVAEFTAAIERADFEAAVALYEAPFLDGFHLSGCPDFERWVDDERARLAREYAKAIENVAETRAQRGLLREAADAWRRLAGHDRSNSRIAASYMEALASIGERAAAIEYFRLHTDYLKSEFGAEPEAQLLALAERLRSSADNGTGLAATNKHTQSEQVLATTPSAPILPDRTSGASAFATPAKPMTQLQSTRSRRRSWKRFAVVSGCTVAIIGIGGAVVRARTPTLDPKLVLVDVLENETGDSALRPLGFMAADWIVRGLEQTGVVRVRTTYIPLRVQRFGEAPPAGSALPLARAANAGTVIRGRYYRLADSVAFLVQVSDVRSGEVVHMIGPVVSPLTHVEEAVAALRRQTMGLMAVIHGPKFTLTREVSPPPSLEAYQTYVSAERQPNIQGQIAAYSRAAQLAPQWELPVLHEMFRRWAFDDFRGADSVLTRLNTLPLSRFGAVLRDGYRGILHNDVAGADEAVRQWVAEAPTSFEGTNLFVDVLLRENHPRELLDIVDRFDWRNAPPALRNGDPVYVLYALHFLGDLSGELAEARHREQLPTHDVWMSMLLTSESRALAALGRARELDPVFDRLLAISSSADITPGQTMMASAEELMGHGHPNDATAVLRRALRWFQTRTDTTEEARVALLQARALYELGQLDEAEEIATKQLRPGSPLEAAPWALLGVIAAHRGNRDEALRISTRLATTPMNDLQDHIEVAQAKIAMALGDRDVAMLHLQRACGRGCDAFTGFLETDYDLLPLHSDPRFVELMRPKG